MRPPYLTISELRALLNAANDVEAGEFEGPPWEDSADACDALLSTIQKLRNYLTGRTNAC